ncbi:MAG: prephenate dehydratase [Deltaproteobacteria bacterium]|nr:prephenate dehydratase [Deltaproteobacteria bacterium]
MSDSDPKSAPRPLAELRARIDALDERILELLNERARVAAEVGEWKRTREPDAPFHVPAREREVLARLEARNPGPFPRQAVRAVFQEVMSACLSLERPLRVAFLGPEGDAAHQAVKHQFGLSTLPVAQRSIEAVFHAVEAGQADYGVVPVENATEGSVDATLDAFLESELRVVAEIQLPLQLALLAPHDVELAAVRRVYGRPEALQQAREWLAAQLPGAAQVAASSPGEAGRLARSDPEGAAVAPEVSARLFDLRVAAEGVQGAGAGATRFWVLGRRALAPSGRDRTSIAVSVKDGPGVLLRVLDPLARHGINLTRIESRPSRRRSWEYVFFLDLEGHEADGPVAAALAEVALAAAGVKRLGSYPRGEPGAAAPAPDAG